MCGEESTLRVESHRGSTWVGSSLTSKDQIRVEATNTLAFYDTEIHTAAIFFIEEVRRTMVLEILMPYLEMKY
jgi:hypothetical protein